MATSRQEQLYNEIVEYYSFADQLMKAIEDANHDLAGEEFKIAEQLTNNLEECADKLANHYIQYIKGGQSQKVLDSVRESLNSISTTIEESRAKITALYQA